MVRGETRTKKATYGGRDLFYTIWQDRKPVRLLHTIKTWNGTCRRQVKANRTKTWGRRHFQRATIIPVYNNNMGGTDKGDQGATYYRPRVKTRNWISRIFSHFLNIGCVNIFIIIQHLRNNNIQEVRDILPKSQLSFRLKLVKALAKEYQEDRMLPEAESHMRTMSKKQWEKDYSRLTNAHFPISVHTEEEDMYEGKKRPRVEGSNVRNWIRGRCKICTKKVSIQCKSCGVYHCINNDNNDINCWIKFHTCRSFEEIDLNGDENKEIESDELSDGSVTV